CCSLVGDFGKALAQVKAQYDPDRIVIEPSGVGKLSDVIRAVQDAGVEGLQLNAFTTVIDASKCRMYMKNFAEFYRNQIEFASSVILSRTDGIREDKLKDAVEIVRSLNKDASLIITPWDQLDGRAILETMEKKNTLEAELRHLLEEEKEKDAHHHHHHHHDDDEECDDPECECHHHHDDDDDEHGHHHHHHHDGHDADEVFTSWGVETSGKYTAAQIEDCLDELMTGRYGMVLRAKGIVDGGSGEWIHFDYVPGEKEIRTGAPDVIGKLCVIGTGLDKAGLHELFRAE
ncbi:MAG: GTP-binding protein, partial [Clostridia bacterium]|nr:GTP-binding protein [Clostridia bacterium]